MRESLLFAPVAIGRLSLQNRVVLAPMATRFAEEDGSVSDRLVAHYVRFAESGVGLAVVEATAVHESGLGWVRQLRIDDDRYIDGHGRVAAAFADRGVPVVLQIHHAGRQTTSRIAVGGPVSASSTTCPKIGEPARALREDEVELLTAAFVEAARRAKEAGYSGVEIHGAHGYLVHQFLSPHTNRRADGYGGSLESRLRFARGIVEGVRSECGDDFVIGYRVSAEDGVDGGLKVADAVAAMKRLVPSGIDYVSVSNGMAEGSQKPVPTAEDAEPGWLIPFAGEFTRALDVPTIAAGGLARPDLALFVVEAGEAAMVALGRGLLAEPRWLVKVRGGRLDDVAVCIRCRRCTNLVRGCPREVAEKAARR